MDTTPSANYGANLSERLQSPVTQWIEALRSFGRTLRVAMPAIVVSFDTDQQTVAVQPAIREIERIAGVLTTKDLPQLTDVPLVLPRAGGFTLTMPVKAGDECLVVFADSCIDAWWQSGNVQSQFEQRRHHLADAFAILGTWSQPRVLSGYSTHSAQLRSDDGAVSIDIAAAEVTVTAPKVNIVGNGQTFIDNRNFLLHTHSGGGSGPVV